MMRPTTKMIVRKKRRVSTLKIVEKALGQPLDNLSDDEKKSILEMIVNYYK